VSPGLIALGDKGSHGYDETRERLITPYKGKNKLDSQKDANRAHARLRGPGERANAQLKYWRILHKVRVSPRDDTTPTDLSDAEVGVYGGIAVKRQLPSVSRGPGRPPAGSTDREWTCRTRFRRSDLSPYPLSRVEGFARTGSLVSAPDASKVLFSLVSQVVKASARHRSGPEVTRPYKPERERYAKGRSATPKPQLDGEMSQ
jgi:hypothetical protein